LNILENGIEDEDLKYYYINSLTDNSR